MGRCARLIRQPADSGSGDAILFRDFCRRHSGEAVLDNCNAVNVRWCATDSSAFQSCSANPRRDPFDDQRPLEFGYCSSDDGHGPAERTSSIDVFTQADEFDAEMIQLIEHFEEMAGISSGPIESGDDENIETVSPSITH
jgi:hypothetical protein